MNCCCLWIIPWRSLRIMLSFDFLLLKSFLEENISFFENARVQKIQQPTRREIILHLRNNGESRKFYININPAFYHVCFINKANEERRNLQIPKQPPMFCMLLRKHMEGARIIKVNIPEYERILELYFENYNELGDRVEECLSIELMGKHSNVVLYNTDNNIILGCAHNIGEEKSKERELAGGLPYIYPPKQDKKNFLNTRFDWFAAALKKSNDILKKSIASRYFGLSQAFVEEVCFKNGVDAHCIANSLDDVSVQKLFVYLHEVLAQERFKYSISSDYDRYSCLSDLQRTYETLNDLIDDYFSYHIEKNIVSSLKASLSIRINRELKKLNNTYAGQKKQLDKKDKLELYKTKGNLLTANSYAISSGQKIVSLINYETGKSLDIELDETKTVIENAQRYFALYNKGKKAFQVAMEMSEKTLVEISWYKQLLYNIDICSSFVELAEIYDELEPEKKVDAKKNKNSVTIERREIGDFLVFIGKNNKQNDYLYSKISSPDDYWFHVVNTPGSHIIAKPQNSTVKMTDDILLAVAKLAKEFSTAKNATKAPVAYTLRKYVKRPQNTSSGFVVYKNEEEIVVD